MPSPRIRKDMPDVQLTRERIQTALPGALQRSGLRRRWRRRSTGSPTSPGKPMTTPARRRAPAAPAKAIADPDYELSVDWIAATRKIQDAERRHKDPSSPPRILLINGSTRSEHTCPGEISKTWRLAMIAREMFARRDGLRDRGARPEPARVRVRAHDPSRARPASRPRCRSATGRAPAIPTTRSARCSDWMNDIYPMWVAAHGIMIVSPVNWYQAPSTLKLMIDRLVCADGGNPDPTSTARQGRGTREGDRARGLALSAPPRRPGVLGSCTATPPASMRCVSP